MPGDRDFDLDPCRHTKDRTNVEADFSNGSVWNGGRNWQTGVAHNGKLQTDLSIFYFEGDAASRNSRRELLGSFCREWTGSREVLGFIMARRTMICTCDGFKGSVDSFLVEGVIHSRLVVVGSVTHFLRVRS